MLLIFLIFFVLFSYVLHTLCERKGVSPWGYLTTYAGGWLIIMILSSAFLVLMCGTNFSGNPDTQKKIMSLAPLTMLLQYLLFLILRRKIESLPDFPGQDDDFTPPPPKKDLSYFR